MLECEWVQISYLLNTAVVQKKAQESINSRLTLVMKSGKYVLGTKTALKTLRSGKGNSHATVPAQNGSERFLRLSQNVKLSVT